jgi:hypothetical protein
MRLQYFLATGQGCDHSSSAKDISYRGRSTKRKPQGGLSVSTTVDHRGGGVNFLLGGSLGGGKIRFEAGPRGEWGQGLTYPA